MYLERTLEAKMWCTEFAGSISLGDSLLDLSNVMVCMGK
jgi:hypothetical protein